MSARHEQYLMELFQAMSDAGFENIRIDDEDLAPYTVGDDGSAMVIAEMRSVDDAVTLKADLPRPGGEEPHTMTLLFILENSPKESLADYTIPCERADELMIEILDRLEEKPL